MFVGITLLEQTAQTFSSISYSGTNLNASHNQSVADLPNLETWALKRLDLYLLLCSY